MRNNCLLLLFLCGGHIAAQNVTKPLTITISAASPTVMTRSAAWITVKLTNRSHHEIDESGSVNGMTGLDPNLLFDVRDSHGNAVAKRFYSHPELATGTPLNRGIGAGEIMTEEQDVSRLYDMSRSGSYVVQVSRELSHGRKARVVKSNEITIVVTDALP